MKEALKKTFGLFFDRGSRKTGGKNRFQNYVALGDSIISDDYPGPEKGAAALLYRNKDDLFPEFEALHLKGNNPGIQFLNVTKTGWMFPDLLKKAEELEASNDPTLIVICAGGNDLLHAHSEMQSMDEALAKVNTNLHELRAMLKKCYPKSVFRVVNTYDPTDGTGLFQSGRRVPECPEAIYALNSTLADVAGSDLVDIHSHFQGHGMRHSDPAYHNYKKEDPSGWIKFDIEPNNRGAHEVRRKLWESLQ